MNGSSSRCTVGNSGRGATVDRDWDKGLVAMRRNWSPRNWLGRGGRVSDSFVQRSCGRL
jgi:hypothetical protein